MQNNTLLKIYINFSRKNRMPINHGFFRNATMNYVAERGTTRVKIHQSLYVLLKAVIFPEDDVVTVFPFVEEVCIEMELNII